MAPNCALTREGTDGPHLLTTMRSCCCHRFDGNRTSSASDKRIVGSAYRHTKNNHRWTCLSMLSSWPSARARVQTEANMSASVQWIEDPSLVLRAAPRPSSFHTGLRVDLLGLGGGTHGQQPRLTYRVHGDAVGLYWVLLPPRCHHCNLNGDSQNVGHPLDHRTSLMMPGTR
jgi:hypothetical protein